MSRGLLPTVRLAAGGRLKIYALSHVIKIIKNYTL
jgi:hypothetical protein